MARILTKAAVKRYGVMSVADREIAALLLEYQGNKSTLYWKNKEISELKEKIAKLENEQDNLYLKQQDIFKNLNEIFLDKAWHAPSIETINHAMDEIIKFRKENLAIDDDGNISFKKKEGD